MTLEEWVKKFRDKIVDPNDYIIFDEISGCFQAGFLRSAYIVSWIAIAENLKSKILQSSNLGDKQSEVSLKVIEDAESKKLSVDKIILEEATKLNIVDTPEQSVLTFLWQQRCLFAHPYNIAPNEDELKHIIMHLVDICLSKPLLFKKSYLSELVNNIVTKSYFLTSERQKNESYYLNILNRVTEDLHPFLFKTLLYQLGLIVEDDTKDDIRFKLRLFLIKLLEISKLPLSDSSWSLENRAVNFPYAVFYGCVHIPTWAKFPLRIKEILVNYGVAEKDEKKLVIIKYWFYHLISANILEDGFREKFYSQLDAMSFNMSINFYGKIEQTYDRVISEFNTGNFVKQNAVIEFLKGENGPPFIKKLNESQQIGLGQRIVFCARNGCWSGVDYFNSLKTTGTPKNVSLGILLGTTFNTVGDFYVSLEYFKTAVKIIEQLGQNENLEIFKAFEETIDGIENKTHHLNIEELEDVKAIFSGMDPKVKAAGEAIIEKLKLFKFDWDSLSQ